MFRQSTLWPRLALLLASGSACESLVGSVEVFDRPPLQRTSEPEEVPPTPSPGPPVSPPSPAGATPVEAPGSVEPAEPPSVDAGPADADGGDGGRTAPPPPPPPPALRPILVDGPSTLERVGLEGGDPRLGSCEGGFAVGVRTTANPNEGVFGERVTFVEPVCARAIASIPSPDSPETPSVELLPDPARLAWSDGEPFLGPPLLEEPDARITWVPQPPTLCSASAPVLVGVGGEYDPIAPDATDTAVIRSFVIECAPLLIAAGGSAIGAAESGHELVSNAAAFAADGDDTFASACPAGAVVTQIRVHAGYWLDGFALGCSRLSAGEPALPASEPE